MWHMIPSLDPLVQALVPAFTQPSFHSGCQLLLAWIMCLGRHTLYRVGTSAHPETLPDHTQRHVGQAITTAKLLFALRR